MPVLSRMWLELAVFKQPVKICQSTMYYAGFTWTTGQMNCQTKSLMFQVLFFSYFNQIVLKLFIFDNRWRPNQQLPCLVAPSLTKRVKKSVFFVYKSPNVGPTCKI